MERKYSKIYIYIYCVEHTIYGENYDRNYLLESSIICTHAYISLKIPIHIISVIIPYDSTLQKFYVMFTIFSFYTLVIVSLLFT